MALNIFNHYAKKLRNHLLPFQRKINTVEVEKREV